MVEDDGTRKLPPFVAALLGGGAVNFPTVRVFEFRWPHGVEISTAADSEVGGDGVAFLDLGDCGAGGQPEVADGVVKTFRCAGWERFCFRTEKPQALLDPSRRAEILKLLRQATMALALILTFGLGTTPVRAADVAGQDLKPTNPPNTTRPSSSG